jgi:hypothetical protein
VELAHRWSDRNLTRKELVIAILILALLIGFFSRYTLSIFSQAERSMVNRTIININTALNYRASLAVMMGRYNELIVLLNNNPFESMQSVEKIGQIKDKNNNFGLLSEGSFISTPVNYEGVLVSGNTEFMEKGKWYYQKDKKILIYTLKNNEYFKSELEGLPRIRYRIKLDYLDINANGQFDENLDQFNGVRIQAIDEYTWDI